MYYGKRKKSIKRTIIMKINWTKLLFDIAKVLIGALAGAIGAVGASI